MIAQLFFYEIPRIKETIVEKQKFNKRINSVCHNIKSDIFLFYNRRLTISDSYLFWLNNNFFNKSSQGPNPINQVLVEYSNS